MWWKPICFTEFVRGLAKNLLATCDAENRLDMCVLENLLEMCVHCGRFRVFLWKKWYMFCDSDQKLLWEMWSFHTLWYLVVGEVTCVFLVCQRIYLRLWLCEMLFVDEFTFGNSCVFFFGGEFILDVLSNWYVLVVKVAKNS